MPDVVVQGELGPLSLAGVLQLLEGEALTGRLRLHAGSIELSQGRPVGASCAGRDGTTAFLELFLGTGGPFSFERDHVSGESLGSLLGLIMEGCRLDDEWSQLNGLILVPSAGAEAEGVCAEVLAALDGTRSVDTAVRHVGGARVLVVDPLRSLLESGLLHEVTRPPPTRRGSVPPTEGYARAMEDGRSKLRAGDFDSAEAAFELALTLRPDDVIARQNLRRVRQVRSGDGQPYTHWVRRR